MSKSKLMVNNRKMKVKERKSSDENFEQLLYISFVAIFFILVITQAMLMSPTMHSYLDANNSIEGVPLASEEFLYEKGQISLALVGQNKNESIKVMINGEVTAAFSTEIVYLDVKSGDVIEIDGRNLTKPAGIEITSVSSNIPSEYIGEFFNISSGIQKIITLKFK